MKRGQRMVRTHDNREFVYAGKVKRGPRAGLQEWLDPKARDGRGQPMYLNDHSIEEGVREGRLVMIEARKMTGPEASRRRRSTRNVKYILD